ncbi:nucleoid-associated protein [Nitrosomonas sp. ANs5]|uniref:nucleoid-associated protein n=1 Tax=Nitrosomonas sp. ANs5 TaxID=3423941 RepID=UPI003D327851
MNISNIKAHRIITHEVVRAQELEERAPILSDSFIELDDKGNSLISKRLVDTLSSGSHCVEVAVDDATEGSPFSYISSMFDSSDQSFINHSKHLSKALSQAQTAGSIKAGSAIFIQGTCIADDRESRFMAIIKADSDQALQKQSREEGITLIYINDMILGQSQKLFKIAFFVEIEDQNEGNNVRESTDYKVKVFDHMMQKAGNGNAALYFYSSFLKCRIADNASRQTKVFYEVAKSFIDGLPIDQSEKVELKGDVISYLRSNKEIISPREFSKDVLPEDQQDNFINLCKSRGISEAISKDLTLLKGRLRRQSVKFASGVTLYASPDVFKSAVKVGDFVDGWTDIKVQGKVESEK